jgi:hypothetical protein
MPERSKEQEYREEADRLALLPREEQRGIIALHRAVAEDLKVSKANRREAGERAEALERYLRLPPTKRRKKP